MEAIDNTNNVAPANTEVFIKILKSFFSVNVLYTNSPIRMEYTVATQAPSVGVKYPDRMPEIRITGIISAAKLSLREIQISRPLAFGCRG